jgi:hypothetical protein
MSCNTGPPPASAGRGVGVLLGVLLAVVVLGDLPVVHAHDAPGLYDEDCPLERLAGAPPQVSLPQTLLLPLPVSAPEAVPTRPLAATGGALFAAFDSRAPPVLVLT